MTSSPGVFIHLIQLKETPTYLHLFLPRCVINQVKTTQSGL